MDYAILYHSSPKPMASQGLRDTTQMPSSSTITPCLITKHFRKTPYPISQILSCVLLILSYCNSATHKLWCTVYSIVFYLVCSLTIAIMFKNMANIGHTQQTIPTLTHSSLTLPVGDQEGEALQKLTIIPLTSHWHQITSIGLCWLVIEYYEIETYTDSGCDQTGI